MQFLKNEYTISNSVIRRKNNCKVLGVHFQQHFKFNQHYQIILLGRHTELMTLLSETLKFLKEPKHIQYYTIH